MVFLVNGQLFKSKIHSFIKFGRVKKISGIDLVEIGYVRLYESYFNKVIMLINDKYIKIKARFQVTPAIGGQDPVKEPLNVIFASQ